MDALGKRGARDTTSRLRCGERGVFMRESFCSDGALTVGLGGGGDPWMMRKSRYKWN